MSNVLPLLNGQGLDSRLDLYVFDKQTIREGETLRFEITIPNTRHIANSQAQRRNPGRRGSVRGGQRDGYNRTASRVRELPPMKITICWYDPPAPLGSSRALLMHDLDLVVLAPDGALHWGNANKGQDLKSSEDGTKGAQRSAGDPYGTNSSFPGWAWADDVNPNEQVYIQVLPPKSFFTVLSHSVVVDEMTCNFDLIVIIICHLLNCNHMLFCLLRPLYLII